MTVGFRDWYYSDKSSFFCLWVVLLPRPARVLMGYIKNLRKRRKNNNDSLPAIYATIIPCLGIVI